MEESNFIEFYDRTASNLGKRFNLRARSEVYAYFYLPKLLEWAIFEGAENVLEVGAGYGDKLLKTKAKLNDKINILGVDASTAMLKAGLSKYPELKNILRVGNAFDLNEVANESQDVLMYYQILHHFAPSELEKIIDIAYQKLNEGGRLVIIDSFELQKPLRRLAFNIIEPVYTMISARRKNGRIFYHDHPKDNFVAFVESQGFDLSHETGDKFPYIISEILVFQKTPTKNLSL